MSKQPKQTQITDPTNPNQIPQVMQPLTKPAPQPKPEPQKPVVQFKPIPKETQILCEMLEAQEGILYATRQRILQEYAPQEYTQQKRTGTETDLQMQFTEEQVNRLSFAEKDGYWIIKPKQFLGSEMFSAISYTIRGLVGEYISAGKDSHFRIKKA